MLSAEKYIAIFLHNRPHFGAQMVHIPFLVMLRKQYPHSKLIGVSKNSSASILVDAGFLDCLEVVETKKHFKLLKKYTFDIGINLRPSSIGVAFQMLLLKIPHRIGFKKFGAFYNSSATHDTTIYRANSFLKLLYKKDCSSSMPFIKESVVRENDFMGSILLAPGAGREKKKWPIEKYMLLADEFILRGEAKVFFITGPQENKERVLLENKGFKVFNNPDLKFLFSLVDGCKIFVSNDCGPSHVAHILGVNQVVIFNNLLPEWFLKRENSTYVTSSSSITEISVEEVIQKVITVIDENK